MACHHRFLNQTPDGSWEGVPSRRATCTPQAHLTKGQSVHQQFFLLLHLLCVVFLWTMASLIPQSKLHRWINSISDEGFLLRTNPDRNSRLWSNHHLQLQKFLSHENDLTTWFSLTSCYSPWMIIPQIIIAILNDQCMKCSLTCSPSHDINWITIRMQFANLSTLWNCIDKNSVCFWRLQPASMRGWEWNWQWHGCWLGSSCLHLHSNDLTCSILRNLYGSKSLCISAAQRSSLPVLAFPHAVSLSDGVGNG